MIDSFCKIDSRAVEINQDWCVCVDVRNKHHSEKNVSAMFIGPFTPETVITRAAFILNRQGVSIDMATNSDIAQRCTMVSGCI